MDEGSLFTGILVYTHISILLPGGDITAEVFKHTHVITLFRVIIMELVGKLVMLIALYIVVGGWEYDVIHNGEEVDVHMQIALSIDSYLSSSAWN